MSQPAVCPVCGRARSRNGCEYCLLYGASTYSELGSRPLWEDLGETGDVFQVIDGFAVLRRLGEGGMGEVFLARQLSTGRTVALKLLRIAGTTARFRTEIAALATLRHPGLVSILYAGDHAGRPYFAMDWVDGPDLAAWIKNSTPTIRQIVTLTLEVADAVQHAHDQGILHRDLKPQNILVGSDGSPRVTDFGLARFLDGEESSGLKEGMTSTGTRLGTPAYMAPEQVRGDRAAEGWWTDVYGLGATLYFLLTGVAPFRGDTAESVFQSVLEQDVVSLRALRPDCDRDLETVVLGALDKECRSRYPSVEAWQADLARWLAGEPIARHPPGPLGKAVRWCRRHPSVTILAAGILVVAALGAGSFSWQWIETRRANERLSDSIKSLRLTESNRLLTESNTAGALRVLARQLQSFPEDRTSATRIMDLLSRRRFLLPESVGGPTPGPMATGRWTADGSRILMLSYQRTNGPLEMRLWDPTLRSWASASQPLGELAREARFDGSGKWLLTQSANGLQLWHAHNLESAGAPFAAVLAEAEFVWHPKGEDFFSWSSTNRLFRMRTPPRQPVWERAVDGQILCLAVSGDGRTVGVGTSTGLLMWFDATTGDPLGSALDNPGPVVSLALDNDGQRAGVVVDWGQNNYRFLWWNIALGKAVGPSPANGPAVFGAEGALLQGLGNPATILLADSGSNGAILLREEIPWTGGWLGQTEELVTLARGHELRIRNGRTGAASSEALLAATHVEDVVASPDGKHLLQIDISREITVLSTDRMPIQAAVLPSTRVGAFSPSGQFIVTGGQQGELTWRDPATGGSVQAQSALSGQIRVIRFSPDGGSLFVGTSRGDARLWRGADHGVGQRLEWATNSIQAARFSPDGTMLAVLGENSDLRFYKSSTGQPMTPTIPVESGIASPFGKGSWTLDFSPDGHQVAVGSYSASATVWEAGTTNRLLALRHPISAITDLRFGPDGSWLGTVSLDGFVRIWDLVHGQERTPAMRHGGNLTSLAVSPDGRLLASAGTGGTIRLWRVADGSGVAELTGHSDEKGLVYALSFSPNGRRLASACQDGTARIWDVATGLQTMDPFQMPSACISADWSPNGRQLLLTSSSATGWLHRIPEADGSAPAWLAELANLMAGNSPELNVVRTWDSLRREALDGRTPPTYRSWAHWFFGHRTNAVPGNPGW